MLALDQDSYGIQTFDTRCASDNRGSFCKWFETRTLPDFHVRQMNFVVTSEALVLRGLHYQQPHPEAKLFRVLRGAMQLAMVRVQGREDGDLAVRELVLDNPNRAVLVPRGFATGYLTLLPDTQVLYLSNEDFRAEAEGGFRWDDPKLAIAWRSSPLSLSPKDAGWQLL